MSSTDDLLRHAEAYAAGFDRGDLEAAPARKVAVLTCMDARVVPGEILGLAPGDAHVMRNAGGVVTHDALRSLAISQHMLGTREIVVIHHTDCGLLRITDEDFAQRLESATGERPEWRAHAFADSEEHMRQSLRRIRENPFLQLADSVRGFVYEVETGRLREVA